VFPLNPLTIAKMPFATAISLAASMTKTAHVYAKDGALDRHKEATSSCVEDVCMAR